MKVLHLLGKKKKKRGFNILVLGVARFKSTISIIFFKKIAHCPLKLIIDSFSIKLTKLSKLSEAMTNF